MLDVDAAEVDLTVGEGQQPRRSLGHDGHCVAVDVVVTALPVHPVRHEDQSVLADP